MPRQCAGLGQNGFVLHSSAPAAIQHNYFSSYRFSLHMRSWGNIQMTPSSQYWWAMPAWRIYKSINSTVVSCEHSRWQRTQLTTYTKFGLDHHYWQLFWWMKVYIINAPHARQTNIPKTTRRITNILSNWCTILHLAECNYATTKNNSSSNIPVEKVMSDDDTNNNIFMNGMM